jgi:hypothetical protein
MKIPTPFVWESQELLESDAWRSRNIHVRRLIDFLLIEHINHGGKRNGLLLAPYRQLYAFGIGARFTAATIHRAEELGLIVCVRGSKRIATTYRLTWLPDHDDGAPTDDWRAYRNQKLQPLAAISLHAQGTAKVRNLHSLGNAKMCPPKSAKGNALLRKESSHGVVYAASREASVVLGPWAGRKRGRRKYPHPRKEHS